MFKIEFELFWFSEFVKVMPRDSKGSLIHESPQEEYQYPSKRPS